ncbi:nuclear pore complex protein Nup50-like [Trichoplusia ni]|uniref:Nuclear pore complex protein Nup50-like n=1 Tax=Trichoplusia ni TaxID=7111 RepID=A0A7E5X0P3_TRINI|nr:nuclear pore complex protein Nup50-like [Trichoplusia ni]XP_026747322.1 nuclear pore complex protein Nup50-like [Trichoplusia ni]
MSIKRQATTELNHDNWDKEDPADHEEMGSFKIATKDILEKRVIRTAKRRSQLGGDEPKKSVFSGFSGFASKPPPSSFDFLSKLTNGSNDNSSSSKVDSSVTSSLFTSKPIASSPSSGIFGIQSTTSPAKSPFGSPSTQTGTGGLFGVSSPNTTSTPSMFITSKADSTVKDSPFKIQTVTSSTDNNTDSTKSSMAPVTSTKFDIPSTSANVAKSLFSTTSNTTPFKIQPSLNAHTATNNFGTPSKPESKTTDADKKSEDTKDESKMKYYSKLKGLNESVSDWIKKHVEQTPLCILTPIFKDYEKYLKEIQNEYQSPDEESITKSDDKDTTSEPKSEIKLPTTDTPKPAIGSSIFNTSQNSKSLFGNQSSSTSAGEKSGSFSFGIGSSTNTSSTITTSSAGFSFGAITSSTGSATTSSSPFSFATTTSTASTNGTAAPFSFGIGKPFSFNSNIKQNTENTEEKNDNEDEDTPPKVEFTPVVEENSVFEKRCKVFVKKDGNFVDKGVGTLYIKKIEETGKHQLLIRANTNLGTILVNMILASAIPTQRMGKNNVMFVCIPTPDSKPPPTPILIRVKTTEEADQLLETLNKYKT